MAALCHAGAASDGVYLTYLLSNDNISRDEIYSNVMEMLFAATDTVRLLYTIPCHIYCAPGGRESRVL